MDLAILSDNCLRQSFIPGTHRRCRVLTQLTLSREKERAAASSARKLRSCMCVPGEILQITRRSTVSRDRTVSGSMSNFDRYGPAGDLPGPKPAKEESEEWTAKLAVVRDCPV